MPRIPDEMTQAVCFLYPSADAAERHEGTGGTGFFVAINSRTWIITNRHVAATCSWTSLGSEIDGWVGHPRADDIMVAPVQSMPDGVIPLNWPEVCPTPDRMEELNVGVGDLVVMIGRFVAIDGTPRIQPLARFGSIAMMPGPPVTDGRGLKVTAYLVEMHSLSGFSGSPVFVVIGPGDYRATGTMMPFYQLTIGLLGIDCGHVPIAATVVNDTGERLDSPRVELNSGFAVVSPTDKIRETLREAGAFD